MPSEMMDRVAAVINQHKYTHDEYPLARLTMEAMREPTDEMIVAGVQTHDGVTYSGIPSWQSMIDAAIGKK